MRKLIFSILLVAFAFTVFAGVLNYAIYEEPKTLNPWNHYGPNATVWNSYVFAGKYGALYTYSDVRFDFIPSLAKDMPEKAKEGDYYVYTIPLREDVVWSDGTKFTADDVVFTINTVLDLVKNHGLGGNWASFVDPQFVVKVEKVDDYTVKIYFHKLGLAKVEFGVLMCPILQKKFWEKYVEEALNSANPLNYLYNVDVIANNEPVLGAFVHKKWEKGAFVENEARKDYYDRGFVETLYKNGAVELKNPNTGFEWKGYGEPTGEKELVVETGPFVDSVIYRIYLNRAAAIASLINGDVAFIFNPLGLQKGEQDQLKGKPGIKLISSPSNGFRYIAFNMRRYPMNIKEFRQAVAVLIDRDFLCNKILAGQAIPLSTVVPPGNSFWYNKDVKIIGQGMSYGERRKKAIELLKKAGFKWLIEPKIKGDKVVRKGKGLIGPDGKLVETIELLAPGAGYDPMRATAALFIEQWANEIGIPIKAKLVDFNYIVQKVWEENFNFDIYMLGWGLSLYPDYLSDFFHSRRAGPGDYNTPGYSNPKFDELADKFLSATDLEEARKLAFKLQEILAEDLPYAVLFTSPIVEAYRSDMIKFPYESTLDGLQGVNGLPASVKLIQ